MSDSIFILLIIVVGMPIFGAVVTLALRDKCAGRAGVFFSILTAIAGISAIVRNFPNASNRLFGSMPWLQSATDHAVHLKLFGVAIDPLSSIMLIVTTVIGALIAIYSTEYLSRRNVEHPTSEGQGRYYFWLLLFIGSMTGLAVSPNLLQLFIFWELTTLCSWALISFTETEKALKAGFKALIMTHLGAIFFLIGLLILFISTKSFDFSALASPALSDATRSFVFIMFLVAAWAKAAQIPFHTWLPEAMEAPTPISAYLHAAAMVKAGVYLIARIVGATWAASTGATGEHGIMISNGVGIVVGVMAILTMLMAMMFYFLQDDLKRLLAYSTIAHLGYVLLGLSLGILGSAVAYQGGVLHIICHGFAKTTLFLAVGAVSYAAGTRSISKLGGVAKQLPIAAAAFFVGAFAATGLPPFACFWSKFWILTGAMATHTPIGVIFLVLALGESLVSFAWFLRIGQRVFFGTAPEGLVVQNPSPAINWVLIALIVMCIAAPFIGLPLVEAIKF